MSGTKLTRKLAAIVFLSLSTAAAGAATLDLNYTATSVDGLNVLNSSINPVINLPDATWTASYGNSYMPTLNYSVPGTGYEFFDDYLFTVNASSVSSVTASVQLGNSLNIDSLSVRLFSWNGLNEQLYGTVTTADSSLLGFNLIAESANTTVGSADYALISETVLTPGTYVLQVRGIVTGTAGGSYGGNFNVTPVPLPAALPLLLSGLGLLGFARRRGET